MCPTMDKDSNLTFRSSRSGAAAPSPPQCKECIAKSAPNGIPKNILPHRRRNQISQQNPNYALPCFRIRSTKSTIMTLIGACIILFSVMTSFLAYKMNNMSPNGAFYSPSNAMILPSAKEWGAGRASRRKKKKQRVIYPIENAGPDTPKKVRRVREVKGEVITPVSSHVFGAHLTSFYNKLKEEGDANALSFEEQDSLGQDMSVYANIGCSVFNKLYGPNSENNTSINELTENQDRIRRFWSSHVASVLEASHHADDKSYAHMNWTSTLLKSLSPYSLADSLSFGKRVNSKDVERILGIIVRRLLGLMHAKEGAEAAAFVGAKATTPPPLQIAVFGGPTVAGRGCNRARGLPKGQSSMMTNPAFCAFPYRLEQFLNGMLLPPSVLKYITDGGVTTLNNIKVVEVTNLGEEGTYSDYFEAIARNRMYPPGTSPDLIIQAYGIDDYGIDIPDVEPFYAAVGNTFKGRLKDGCSKEDQKPPPVVLRAVLEDNGQSTDLVISSILGEAIDDVEEGEPSHLSTDDNIVPINEGGAFGMAGHVAASWVLAFDLAHAALNHCTLNSKTVSDTSHRPVIHKRAMQDNENMFRCDNGIFPPCIFSIYSGSKGNVARPSFLLQSIMPFIVENSGWIPSTDLTAGFSRKTGIVASISDATMTLLFRNITRPVRRFDVITLRSTSEIWRDGAAQFSLVTGGDFSHGEDAAEASVQVSKETSFVISAELIADGEEDTHITYHFGVSLVDGENAAEAGSDVLLKITLTKGDKFKILGLMLCE